MSVSLAYLERCSADTGFQVGALGKVVRLGEFAGEVARHPLLKTRLTLKGGTALNLGFGPPSRLSVDLDFNYIGAAEREIMLAERPGIEAAICELAKRAGYRVQQSAEAFAGRKIYLHYQSALGAADRIEVDLNYLFRVPLDAPVVRELWQPGDLDRPSVKSTGNSELLTGKLLAFLDRCAARDAWDVANLSAEMVDCLGSPTFRSLFIAISGMLPHPLSGYSQERMKVNLCQDGVDEHLVPMLVQGTAVTAEELILSTWPHIQPLVILSPDEERYCEELSQGRLDLELLFPDNCDQVDRLSNHPALLWKAQNANIFRRGDR